MNVKYFITSYDPKVYDYFSCNPPSINELYAMEGYADALYDLIEASQMSIALEAEEAPKTDEQNRTEARQKEQNKQDQLKKEEDKEKEADQKVESDKAESDAKDKEKAAKDNSIWGGIKKIFMSIIEWITGGSGRLFDVLNQLNDGLTLEIHDVATAIFAYKIDKHYDSLEKIETKMHEVLEIMVDILNHNKYDDETLKKLNLASSEVRNMWEVDWGGEGFLSHSHKNKLGDYNNSGKAGATPEDYKKTDSNLISEKTALKTSSGQIGKYNAEAVKAYYQNGEYISVSAGVLKQRCRAIRSQFKNYKPAVEQLTHTDNIDKITDERARSEFKRCGSLIAKIAARIANANELIYKVAKEYISSHFDNMSNLKKMALLTKDFEKTGGFTIYYIPKRVFPSTWHFDGSEEDDLSQRLIQAHQKRGGGDGETATFVIANREINKMMSTKGTQFMIQHELGHAKEFKDGTFNELGAGDEAEYRADAYAKQQTGFDVASIRKIFDKAIELVEKGIVKGVNLKKAKILFDNRTIKLGGDYNEKLKPKQKGEKTTYSSEKPSKDNDEEE